MPRLKVLLIVASVVVVAALAADVLLRHHRERFKVGDCVELVHMAVVGCESGVADHVVLGVEDGEAGGIPCGAWPQTDTDLRMDGADGRPVHVCMKRRPQ
ncbi:hypothetical protein Dvina_33550 [Dactylosporangium vinaceum]|uniref:Secreted protein n=1 Tax=Dactylosporangium vinaceum TaxID=53362 RepID=A0ABV5MA93_9ACTN|nr:hypothetical protein [Dactylosporangium vinaceum]UAB93192.1 hypothetical protein Dvina_33550 [Dactylosporangium vinaceum]